MTIDKYQFLDEEVSPPSSKKVSFISAPFSKTTSWVGGTEKGPEAIIDASWALETFDDELLVDTFRVGFETLPPLILDNLTSREACNTIRKCVAEELERQRLPVVIGGEHTVTLPAVEACLAKHPDLHVVQFDAHLDLRNEFNNDPLSHACVMRRIYELNVPFTQIGIRSFSREEWDFVAENRLCPTLMSQLREDSSKLYNQIKKICGPVYITFDVDALDPSIMPATGTPEPDGLSWSEAAGLLRFVIDAGDVVGLDFVEYSPVQGAHHAAFTVAKLIYRTLGYIFDKQKRSGGSIYNE